MVSERSDYRRLLRRLRLDRLPSGGILLGTSLLVGVGAGLGAIVFRWLILGVSRISFEWLPRIISGWGSAYLIIAPTVGGLMVGLLTYHLAREAKGHGVPEVMEAVALRGGRIRAIVAVVKSLASAICIGTGGSVGREGPIVQIGSTLGSVVGQWFRLSDDRIRNLVACGAAGGIAATFNTPIAGVLFALEVIVGDFSGRVLGSVVISAVAASVVGRAAFGDAPAFEIPEYSINSIMEFPMYFGLGLVAAVVAVVYTRSVYMVEDIFDRDRFMPEWSKPAIGGMLLGILAICYGSVPALGYDKVPQIFGVGYESISQGLLGKQAALLMVGLMVLKIASTSLTLGSGGSGGVFAPGLFIGSMLGGSYGLAMQSLFPGIPAPPGAYALVGMGAVFAGSTNASMTAVIIMFEMTGDYKIILPMMLAVVTASLLSGSLLRHESIYTMKLVRRGTRLQRGQDREILEMIRVGEAMSDPTPVHPDMTFAELSDLFLKTNQHGFTVLDHDRLVGIISVTDLRKTLDMEVTTDLKVGDLMTTSLITVTPEHSLLDALQLMGPRDLSRLPVVDVETPDKLVGIVRRSDIIRAYNFALTQRGRLGARPVDAVPRAPSVEVLEFPITDDASCIGRTVAEISADLPKDSLIISLQRSNGEIVFPHGNTRFLKGDRVTAFTRRAHIETLRRCFEED